MVNHEEIFEEINGIWPVKNRPKDVRDIEKENLVARIKTQEDFVKLKNKIEIVVEDYKSQPKKLPQLLNIISSFGQEVVVQPVVTIPVVVTKPVSLEDSQIDNAFEETFSLWPENDIAQNKKFAKQAFVAACKKYSLENVQKACVRYITESTDPNKATLKVLGIRRFVSEDDILDNWISKCEEPLVKYDTAWFDAAWEWYPDFKDKSETKEDSLRFYKRFIKNEEVVDFYCAVQAYRSDRRVEIKDAQFNNTYETNDDVKFTKKFYNFIREWKFQEKFVELSDLIIRPMIDAFTSRNIPYWIVYPEEAHIGAIRYYCKQKNEKNELWGCVSILNAHVEKTSFYLTSGKNHVNVVRNTPVDYSMVSEVLVKLKELAKKPPMKPLERKFE
jgi:hypothetical protein